MKHSQLRWRIVAVAVLAMGLAVGLWACGNDSPTATGGNDLQKPVGPILSVDHPQIQRVMQVQDRHTPDLMRIPGVVGTSTGINDAGDVVINVYLENELPAGKIPAMIEGVAVQAQVTGKLVARKGPPGGGGGGGGSDPKAKQTPPVKMGTSGGWGFDLANGYCCGGTLGSLIQKGGNKYVLSNYHVLYSDIVNGGNGRTWQPGDAVIQPGLIDVNCSMANAQTVATLVNGGGSLPNANVDVGYALVSPGMVDLSGAILNIGTISASTVGASVGQAVKKMGRTTGLARANVSGLNASVSITYENECAGGTSFTKTYTGQIVISNNRCNFLDGGDSGSLMVEDLDTDPRAVGLLYAGSTQCNRSAVAIANPINDVLNWIGGASMVGN